MERNIRIGWCLVALVLLPAVVAENGAGEKPAEDKIITIQMDPYMELCRGTYEQHPAVTSQLYCWYDARNAHSIISPSKVEVLHNVPFVALLHGAVDDSEIEQLQALGDSHIQRSGPTNDSWLPVYYDDHQTYTLHERDHPVVERLTRRVERMTGLSCDTAEDLKVIYNEIGSFKTAELDAIQTKEEYHRFAYAGDRLATVLFFLSDVEKSGNLIFPKLRIGIRPQKGTAAFWYNLKPTGEANLNMKYSICPLQEDSKWTAKKVIHTRGNELRDLCYPSSAPSTSNKD
uniref:Prolyl 4-hydroxylase alpha subunit domain-containing protein n=1 Tax=Anopheles farauti TaxID=69004 RepID=A0A182QEN8_9DIPT